LVHPEGDFIADISFPMFSLYLLSSNTTFDSDGHKARIFKTLILLTEHLIISMVLSWSGKLVQILSTSVFLISANLRCFRLLNNTIAIKHELKTQP